MGSKVPPCLNKSHNFGIYLKKGKRSILQLDFPSQQIMVIRKGHVKKTFAFQSMTFFDSEDDLHISIRFLDEVMEFDADTMEEKYTICRLLDLVLDAENSDDEGASGKLESLQTAPIIPHSVIKDDLLEKKGNTTITTWNRRRVKISVGEFSYYKPGEELALNVVQLWQDRCRVVKIGHNSFSISFSHRDYCFRIPNDSKSRASVETCRDEWAKAFEKAMTSKRHTIRLISSPLGLSEMESVVNTSSVPDKIPGNSQSSMRPPRQRQDQEQQIRAPVNGNICKDENKTPRLPPSTESKGEKPAGIVPSNSNFQNRLGSSRPPNISSLKEPQSQEKVCERGLVLADGSQQALNEPRDQWVSPVSPGFSSGFDSGFNSGFNSSFNSEGGNSPVPLSPRSPPLPPPVPKALDQGQRSKGGLKLRQVYWTPVERFKVAVSLWGEINSQLPALDLQLLEDMFTSSDKDNTLTRSKQSNKQTLLDSKRAQNLEILFSGFKADCLSQFLEAINSISEIESFEMQKLTTLRRLQPTEEDMEMFGMYSSSRDFLEPVDRFMLDICEIPKLSLRIDLALSLWDFPSRSQLYLEEVDSLTRACDAVLESSALPTILRLLLAIGNHLNTGRQPKDGVLGFQICSVDKLVNLKGQDPQYTLMTYLVEQLKGVTDLMDWTSPLAMVPKVAGFSIRAVGAEVDVLKSDLQKVKKYHKVLRTLQGHPSVHKKFMSDLQGFIFEYEMKLETARDKNDKLQHKFRQLLAWLGEPPNRTSEALFSSLALLMERFQQARARVGGPLKAV
ncbi:uncharacterized protein LOC112560491 [Pomacea canaliculata]|uniref:uncharacterized protein LOC112560491 n=1 Tax=Pomacea canaliculata TaxID=400727 RepID=UPI000D73E0DA|nr:uncharacterized protein LOC112560491 [Pomacea canaliculata]XP_025088173.1 uncharacterized protein LOC112560491 [Pomacea canaliculata]